MSNSVIDGAKLDAVGMVAERLEQRAALSRKPEHVFCNALDVARELRSIIAFKLRVVHSESEQALLETLHTERDRAMMELGLWAQRYTASVAGDALVGILLSETSMLHADAGLSRSAHLERCGQVWDVIAATRAEVEGAGGLEPPAVVDGVLKVSLAGGDHALTVPAGVRTVIVTPTGAVKVGLTCNDANCGACPPGREADDQG